MSSKMDTRMKNSKCSKCKLTKKSGATTDIDWIPVTSLLLTRFLESGIGIVPLLHCTFMSRGIRTL